MFRCRWCAFLFYLFRTFFDIANFLLLQNCVNFFITLLILFGLINEKKTVFDELQRWIVQLERIVYTIYIFIMLKRYRMLVYRIIRCLYGIPNGKKNYEEKNPEWNRITNVLFSIFFSSLQSKNVNKRNTWFEMKYLKGD